MKKYFLALCLSISNLHTEETIQKSQIAIEQEIDHSTECICEMCCCAEKESNNASKNPFEQLPQHSFTREFCSGNENNFYCNNLRIYLYCAQRWNNDFSKLEGKSLKEEVLCSYCSDHDHNWQDSIGNTKYWHISYHIKNIGENQKKSPNEIIDETFLMIEHLERLNEPVRNRVQEWKNQKEAESCKVENNP